MEAIEVQVADVSALEDVSGLEIISDALLFDNRERRLEVRQAHRQHHPHLLV